MTQESAPGSFIRLGSGLRLHYEVSGKGELPVILVPGWTLSTRVFERQLSHFSNSREVRIVSLDPRSHGYSEQTEGGHDYRQYARDLEQFIRALGLNEFVLCGWSFATLCILSWVNQFGSDRLRGLVMIDGPPRASGEDSSRQWVTYRNDDADGFEAMFSVDRLRDPETTNQKFVDWLLQHPTAQTRRWLLEMTRRMPDQQAAELNASARSLDYCADLAALDGQVPLLYVMRDGRGAVAGDWSAGHTPAARIAEFGSHMMFWEQPARFNRELESFLAGC